MGIAPPTRWVPRRGPTDQMAQNIALSWLAGGRILELKTVQVDDRLTIPRPCIDMTNVGYNVEWSQELRLRESLREYVAGSMLIDVLREMIPGAKQKSDTILDMSVGYDLAGVRSPEVRSWIASMKDAGKEVDALRREIPEELRALPRPRFQDRALRPGHALHVPRLPGRARSRPSRASCSTELDLHVTVKLNPTLLGREAVDGLLHDRLGYGEVETRPEDFDSDLQWEQALEITDRLTERARSRGRTFRVKLLATPSWSAITAASSRRARR